MALTMTALQVHDGLDCVDVDSLLNASTLETSDLNARVLMLEQRLREAEDQNMRLLSENDRLNTLNRQLISKQDKRDDISADLTEQIEMLAEELEAAEADALPDGTLVYATVSRDAVVETYRNISRINRGPIPPHVEAAIVDGSDELVRAMRDAATGVVTRIVRREVRARRAGRR